MSRGSDLFRVGKSRVGQGVFARRRLERHQLIGQIRGTVIHDPTYGSDYCIDLGDGRRLEPASPFRFLNHCCEPNCLYFVWDDEEQPLTTEQIWLQTSTRIEAGEELTIDYAWPAEWAIPCSCRSPHCRGWIVKRDELITLIEMQTGTLGREKSPD